MRNGYNKCNSIKKLVIESSILGLSLQREPLKQPKLRGVNAVREARVNGLMKAERNE